MSGITTGIGIFSGIDTASLINQLIAIESRPKAAAQIRLTQLQNQQAAVLDINTRLLNLGTAAKSLRQNNIFKSAKATTSNGDVLNATAGINATLGSFNFIVNRLVSTHQQISKGFTNKDTSGVGATEFTFEVGGGRVDSSTKLSALNGGLGIDRGKIEITDADGETATVDLSTAATVDDVINAINSAGSINVTASADGYGLQLDNVQSVSNVFGSETASSLGIAKTAVGNVIEGDQIHALSENTPLSLLRDGNGVSFVEKAGLQGSTVADFVINVAGGGSHSIVLGEITVDDPDPEAEPTATIVTQNAAATLGDIFNIIETKSGGEVTGAISADGTRIELTSGVGDVSVTAGPSNRPTASHLGLLGQPAAPTLTSTRLLSGLNSTLVSNLNGGSGLTATDLDITTRDGSLFNITLDADGSLSDLIATINADTGGAITAALNKTGNGIKLTDNTVGAGSLNVSGGAADDLSLTGTFAGGVSDSGNLQSRYISEATLLSSLRGGDGIGTGSFTVTDSNGSLSTINIGSGDKSVFDIIRKFSNISGVNARINDTGDGIVLEDVAGGSLGLKVADSSGRVARNLNLVGEGDPLGDNSVDGSFERTVEFNATDTLQQVADKVNSAGVGVSASIINDGFGANPFRLVFTSQSSGTIGRTTIDTQGFDLGLTQLTAAQDSVVFFGSTNPADAILLTSSSNTLDNVISGVSINLNTTSTQPVEVNISRDTAAIETAITEFVESFNNVLDRVKFHGRFNRETEERGALLGDGLLQNVERSLRTTIQGEGQNVQSEFSFLFQAGISIGDGGKVEFDSEKFRTAYEQDPAGVAELFSGFKQEPNEPTELSPGVTVANTDEIFSKLGVLEVLAQLTSSFTDSIDGVLTRRKQTFDSQIQLQRGRITQFDVQLEQKRGRLEQQFFAMEQALAQLQAQQSALGSLGAGLAG